MSWLNCREGEEEATKIYKLGLMFNYLDRIGLKSVQRRKQNLKELSIQNEILGFSQKKIPLSLKSSLTLRAISLPPFSYRHHSLTPSHLWQSTHFHLNICSITHRASNKNFLTSSKTVREQKFAYNQLDCHKSSFSFLFLEAIDARGKSGSNYSNLWQIMIN